VSYGWGRNNSGQIGLGYLSESVTEPTLVQSLTDLAVKKIKCGDNYSAAITLDRKILVAGQVTGGRLGLGKSVNCGFILTFQEVNGLSYVTKIACGPNHMLAIVK
jgi:alpha-tubulin suppressor-like RCC1 family protein